ncbi:hypothetical protein [Stenotrophomonas pigmentata]|uniref:hypothetical protein n=1 Tax=Stenotrophomonas pigmentata TaxID=3055080 RepID=UPI0026EF115D|nr:hypothetical protein [Stenotrophomonas sp. 610A2]
MKGRDIKKCCRCGCGVAKHGIVFYTLRLQQWGLNPRGIEETHGLEEFFGGGAAGAALAGIMGTDPDIAVPLSEPGADLWVCAECAITPMSLLGFLQDVIEPEQREDAA